MSVIIFISATSHMTFKGMKSYLPLLPILYFFQPLQALQQVLVIHTFIPEGSVSFVILPQLECCSFQLTLGP